MAELTRFGAVGDGFTDDTDAIQAALESGAKEVVGVPGAVYLIKHRGVLSVAGFKEQYCLKLPSNVIFDLNGATLKLGNGQNAHMIINATAGVSQATDLGVLNGMFDQNKSNQTTPLTGEMACIAMVSTLRLRCYNIVATNVRQFASRFLQCDRAYLSDLYCTDSDGDGWYFGVDAGLSWQVTNSVINNIRADNCTGIYTGGRLQGNPAIFTIQNCEVGNIHAENCNGGFKCQDSSSDSTFDNVSYRGLKNGTANSGFKIQGSEVLKPARMSVRRILSEDAYGSGLYLANALDVTIESYVGRNNSRGMSSGTRDVEIQRGCNGITIKSIRSSNCRNTGAVLVAGSGKVELGDVEIVDPALVACHSAQSGAGSSLDIVSLAVMDHGEGSTTQCLYVSGSAKGVCRRILTNLANSTTTLRLKIAAGNYDYFVGSFQMGPDPAGGVVALASGATVTVVENSSIMRGNVGGSDFVHPIIELAPANEGAAALGVMRASPIDYTVGTGFTIEHSVAGVHDLVLWKVNGWKVLSLPDARPGGSSVPRTITGEF